MALKNTVRDGRKAHCYLLTKASTPVTASTSLTVGKFYVATALGASSGLPDGVPVNYPFYCDSAITLAEGDSVYELETHFMGFANDKSMSSEKSVSENTCDKDKSANYGTDGSANVTGSISGFDMIDDEDSAITIIRRRFNDVLDTTESSAKFLEAQTTVKDLIVFIWDAFQTHAGEFALMDFVPCYITSLEHGAQYQSGQSFSLNFQGCDTTDEGIRRGQQQAKWQGVTEDVA